MNAFEIANKIKYYEELLGNIEYVYRQLEYYKDYIDKDELIMRNFIKCLENTYTYITDKKNELEAKLKNLYIN